MAAPAMSASYTCKVVFYDTTSYSYGPFAPGDMRDLRGAYGSGMGLEISVIFSQMLPANYTGRAGISIVSLYSSDWIHTLTADDGTTQVFTGADGQINDWRISLHIGSDDHETMLSTPLGDAVSLGAIYGISWQDCILLDPLDGICAPPEFASARSNGAGHWTMPAIAARITSASVPASLPLFAAGFRALALFRRRQKD